jgi:hypothetical protein
LNDSDIFRVLSINASSSGIDENPSFLGVLAYNLLHMIRVFYLYGEEVRRSMEWLIRRLIKVGAKIAYHGRRWNVHITSVFPLVHHYRAVLGYG